MAAKTTSPGREDSTGRARLLPAMIRRRAWWALPFLFWTLIVGASLNQQVNSIQRHSLELLESSAREIFNLVVVVRRWNANHGGVYVPVTDQFQPNPYLKVPERDLLTADGRMLTLVNPAFMTRLVAELAQQEKGVRLHITSLKPLRPANAPDANEAKALRAFGQGGRPRYWFERARDGRQLFRYMAPLWVEEPCLKCHADQGYKLGDLRGGVSVTLDNRKGASVEAGRIQQTVILHGAVYLLVLALGWWLLEQLRWRWLRMDQEVLAMRSAMDQVLNDEKMASLGRMVAGFAHEINTPIGIALGALSSSEVTLARIDGLLTTEEVSEEDLRRELGRLKSGDAMAQANLARAVGLIQSFKRTSVDQASEKKRVYDMKELMQDVLHMLHHYLKRLPIKVETVCPDGLRIDGVPGQIQQLLTNLVINSLTHGFKDDTPGGVIRIEVSVPSPGRVHIDYADNGAGMTEEVRNHIFESFYTTRPDAGGTGLGLFICRDLVVNKMQGEITCESAPGQGTRFIIDFPADLAGAQA